MILSMLTVLCQVRSEVDRVTNMEQELLIVEKESIEQWSKERDKNDKVMGESDLKKNVENLKKNVESLSPPTPVKLEPSEEDIKITSIGDLVTVKDKELLTDKFSFMDNSDDQCKVTIKEESDDVEFENERDEKSDSNDKSTGDSEREERSEVPRYKFPTF